MSARDDYPILAEWAATPGYEHAEPGESRRALAELGRLRSVITTVVIDLSSSDGECGTMIDEEGVELPAVLSSTWAELCRVHDQYMAEVRLLATARPRPKDPTQDGGDDPDCIEGDAGPNVTAADAGIGSHHADDSAAGSSGDGPVGHDHGDAEGEPTSATAGVRASVPPGTIWFGAAS